MDEGEQSVSEQPEPAETELDRLRRENAELRRLIAQAEAEAREDR